MPSYNSKHRSARRRNAQNDETGLKELRRTVENQIAQEEIRGINPPTDESTIEQQATYSNKERM